MFSNKDNRNVFIMVLIVLIVSLISLIAVINGIWQIIRAPVTRVADDIGYVIKINRLNYNFPIPE